MGPWRLGPHHGVATWSVHSFLSIQVVYMGPIRNQAESDNIRAWSMNNGSAEPRDLGRCRASARFSAGGKVSQENFKMPSCGRGPGEFTRCPGYFVLFGKILVNVARLGPNQASPSYPSLQLLCRWF
jgi:hypothetical protein